MEENIWTIGRRRSYCNHEADSLRDKIIQKYKIANTETTTRYEYTFFWEEISQTNWHDWDIMKNDLILSELGIAC